LSRKKTELARTSLEHSKIVLAAIIPDRIDLLLKAITQLTDNHFPDQQFKVLFTLLDRCHQVSGQVLTKQILGDSLAKKVDPSRLALFLETYDVLYNMQVSDSDFRWSVEQLKELAAEKATAEAITSGMEILNRGGKGPKGEDLIGHHDARKHVLTKFAEIDRDLSMQESPEGDSRVEGDDVLREFYETANDKGVMFGIPELDAKTNGNQPGELNLVVGYSSSGKTTLATIQLAWSAAIEQGKNVVILTTETLRPQVRRKLICRHSKLPMFGLEHGINSRHLKAGAEGGLMTNEENAALPAVIDDYTRNPNYGKLIIVQVPRGATMGVCEGKLNRFQHEFNVDLAVIDYIPLLKPDRRFNTRREELVATLQEGKQLATTFDDGRGIPIVSPWQVSRDAWKEAQTVGYYNSSALSETSEATSITDIAITILEPQQNESRFADIKAQVVKNRDGEKSNGMDLTVDYATGYWGSTNQGSVLDSNNLLSSNGLFGV